MERRQWYGFQRPAETAHRHNSNSAFGLTEDDGKPTERRALDWLRQACVECSSAYSLAWSSLALLVHRDPAVDLCIKRLHRALDSERSTLNIETLSLAAIGINAAEGNANPFQVLV
jgi:hypothetical protein